MDLSLASEVEAYQHEARAFIQRELTAAWQCYGALFPLRTVAVPGLSVQTPRYPARARATPSDPRGNQ